MTYLTEVLTNPKGPGLLSWSQGRGPLTSVVTAHMQDACQWCGAQDGCKAHGFPLGLIKLQGLFRGLCPLTKAMECKTATCGSKVISGDLGQDLGQVKSIP